jgi:hypothetical protein
MHKDRQGRRASRPWILSRCGSLRAGAASRPIAPAPLMSSASRKRESREERAVSPRTRRIGRSLSIATLRRAVASPAHSGATRQSAPCEERSNDRQGGASPYRRPQRECEADEPARRSLLRSSMCSARASPDSHAPLRAQPLEVTCHSADEAACRVSHWSQTHLENSMRSHTAMLLLGGILVFPACVPTSQYDAAVNDARAAHAEAEHR